MTIPVTVIGGYLGAGKTTLVNQLLRDASGERIAVLVNDFGAIAIDADLIVNRGGPTIELANGCICCTLAMGFAAALDEVAAAEPPVEQIVVEASGVADPLTVGQYGHLPGFSLDAVFTLADTAAVMTQAADPYVGETVLNQLRRADLIALTKSDLVSVDEIGIVAEWMADVAPGVRTVVLDADGAPTVLMPDLPDREQPAQIKAPEFHTWSWTGQTVLPRGRVERFLAELPEGVFRAKGVLWLDDVAGRRTIVQLAGGRTTIVPGNGWGGATPENRLVVIGAPDALDEGYLDRVLNP